MPILTVIESAVIVKPLAVTVGRALRLLRLNPSCNLNMPDRLVNVAEIGDVDVPMVADAAESVTVAESAPLNANEKLLSPTDGDTSVSGPSVTVGSPNLKPVKGGDEEFNMNPLLAGLLLPVT